MPNKHDSDNALRDRQPEVDQSTLLPMLIAGLILIVMGAIIVMNFV